MKTAISSLLSVALSVTVHESTVPAQSSEPVSQPMNVQPASGVAVSVIVALLLVSK